MPRLSVLMPVLNGERYLPAAVGSLMRSLPVDAEVLIMDDGSTDATPSILDNAQARDGRLRIVRHDASAGVSASLNELACLADCQYLARMDADDIVLPSRWPVTIRALERADLAFTSVVYIDADSRMRGMDQPGRFRPAAVPFHLLFGCCLVHPTATIRREVFESLGGYADTRAEDYELWMRAAATGHRLVRTATPGLRYRRHEGQVTVQRPWGDENAESPLYHAFAALLESRLARLPQEWATVFAATLAPSSLDRVSSERILGLHRDIIAVAAGELPSADLALLRWRATREARRIRARVVDAGALPPPRMSGAEAVPDVGFPTAAGAVGESPQCTYVVLCHTGAEAVLHLVRRIRQLSPSSSVLVSHDLPLLNDEQVAAAGGRRLASQVAGRWGDWSIVAKQLEALRAATFYTNPDYVVIVSGQDYPITDLAGWERELARSGIDAVLNPLPDVPRDYEYAWTVHDQPIWMPTPVAAGLRLASNVWRRLRPGGLDAYVVSRGGGPSWWIGTPRRSPTPIPPVKAATWLALSRAAAKEVLRRDAEDPALSTFFRTVRVPDEYYLSSIISAAGLTIRRAPVSAARFPPGSASPSWLSVEELRDAGATDAAFARKLPPDADNRIIAVADALAQRRPHPPD